MWIPKCSLQQYNVTVTVSVLDSLSHQQLNEFQTAVFVEFQVGGSSKCPSVTGVNPYVCVPVFCGSV